MRAFGLGLLAFVVLAAVAFWGLGWDDAVARWALAGQREFQDAMAGAIHRLRAGETGAVMALMGLAFAYGFFHAVGPGHGKILIGGYGMARRVPLLRLSAIALASSLAQAGTAILLVFLGAWLFRLGRVEMTGLAEDWLAPASWAAIAGVGLWLALRGGRGLMRRNGAEHGAGCGHDHGPSPEAATEAGTLRDAALLVAGIAIRPCTGALFLLILTRAIGAPGVGVAGAIAMGLGTASVTIAAALAAVTLREGAVLPAAGQGAARVMPVVEVIAGLAIAGVSGGLLLESLGRGL